MLTKHELLRIIKQYDLEQTGHKRGKYLKKIAPYLERKEILILKGVRRCGKTTLMKQFVQYLVSSGIHKGDILYVNLDDFNFLPHLSIELLELILETRTFKRKQYIFLDEIQRVPKFESWLRTHYDRGTNVKFVISGSNSTLLARELATLLTGRNLTFEIFPLDFPEFKEFTSGSLEEYMSFGGFPEVVLEKSRESKLTMLQGYVTDIITKDILLRRGVREQNQLMLFAQYILQNPGVRLSINKLSKQTSLSKETVKKYIEYMVDAYLIFEVPFFSHSVKSKFVPSNIPKYYVLDLGFYAANTPRTEKGKLFETVVAQHLRRRVGYVSYWKDRHEVDLVVGQLALNVTATDRIPQRERQGLKDFQAKHKKFRSLIISESAEQEGVMPIETFLMSDLPER